jgi:hypothetical protein
MSRLPNAIFLILIWVLAALPFRDGLLYGSIVGAGPDVVSTLWGMWWLQQEGVSALFGAETHLVNFPYGAMGIVLAPSSAILWGILEPMLGIGRAMAVVCWIQVAGFAWAVSWLAKIAGVGAPWHWVAGLSIISARFMFFGIGEASLVAVIAIGIPIGLGALILASREERSRWFVLSGVSAVWMAMENPYLAPVLPGLMLLFAIRFQRKRKKFLGTLALTSVGVLAIASAYSASANPNYPREVAGQMVVLFGEDWKVVDLPWARLKFWEIFSPSEVSWTTSTNNARDAGGGRYLGAIVLALSLWGLQERRSWWFFILGSICVCIAFGSIQEDLAFPFLFLNTLMDVISRPLTQPTRFLVVTMTAFSVCASFGVWQVVKKNSNIGLLLVGCLLIDAFAFGGLSLKLPNTRLPSLTCDLSTAGGILVWPEDAKNGELGTSRLLQMRHEKPTMQIGIASWRLLEKHVIEDVRGAGFSGNFNAGWNQEKLLRLGFTSVLLDRNLVKLAPLSQKDLQNLQDCGSYYLMDLHSDPQ